MSVFSHVVVGLDGSEASLHALRWSVDHVGTNGTVDVVHAGAVTPDVPADIEVRSIHSYDSPPAQTLIQTASEVHADAIVIGPHGSGLGRGLGSVAKQLLKKTPIPLVIIDGAEPPKSEGLKPPVVACVGYGEPAQSAAGWAAEFAQERDLPLVLLHAVAYRPIFPIDSASDVLASYLGKGVAAEWALDELTKQADALREVYPDLHITCHVDTSSVVSAVRSAGAMAELVVLGVRPDDEFMHSIGTPRLRRLVARSTFPTAVVPTL